MRTIKFRGQRIDNKEWVYGDLITNDGLPFIVNRVIESNEEWITIEEWTPVIPETVGQFTGLTDKDEEEIYEGDILEDYLGRRRVVEYFKDGFWLNSSTRGAEFNLRNHNRYLKKIGTIHTNPELLNK